MVGTTYKHYLGLSATVELSKNSQPVAEREIKRNRKITHVPDKSFCNELITHVVRQGLHWWYVKFILFSVIN